MLDGVPEGPHALAEHPPNLITNDGVMDQERKFAGSGPAGRFAAIEFLSDGSPDTFRRLLARLGILPPRFLMGGNSMTSDIRTVLETGGHADFDPHGQVWAHERAEIPGYPQLHHLDSIRALPPLAAELRGRR